MALGALSNLSAEGSLAEAILDAQGVSIVADAICQNIGAVSLLEYGT